MEPAIISHSDKGNDMLLSTFNNDKFSPGDKGV